MPNLTAPVRAPAILCRYSVRLEASPNMTPDLLTDMLFDVDQSDLAAAIVRAVRLHLHRHKIPATVVVTE